MSASISMYSQLDFNYKGFELNDHFKTIPFDYQKQVIEWMKYREDNFFQGINGGFLFLDMGLGKTLCALSIISLSNENEKKTIVVAPSQLIHVWEYEINKHFKDLTLFNFHGPNRLSKYEKYILKNVNQPDIFLVSYQVLANESFKVSSPVFENEYSRLVVDECHYVKNQATQAFKALSLVDTKYKWLLSGTPIINRIQEMYSLLKILKFKRLDAIPQQYQVYNGFNRGGYNQAPISMYKDLQKVLSVISIRRTKEILDLPDKNFHYNYISFDTLEQEFSRCFKMYSRHRLDKLRKIMRIIDYSYFTRAIKQKLKFVLIQCLLGIIFHSRILCCDYNLVLNKIPRLHNKTLEESIEIVKKLNYDDDCPTCFNNFIQVENNVCKHKSCLDCYNKFVNMNIDTQYPICLQCMDYMKDTSYRVIREPSVLTLETHSKKFFQVSSKTRSVLELIKSQLEKGEKVIVVSQWTTYLDKVKEQFLYNFPDVKNITLTGKTTPKKRQKLVNDFQDDETIKVCFASLGSSSEGITLTSASTVILCDIYWNKAKIDQMSDRVYRIGQKKDVNVYNLLVRDSIEIKIKELIEKKDQVCRVLVNGEKITKDTESMLSRLIKLLD
jgi:transcription termination factor 2